MDLEMHNEYIFNFEATNIKIIIFDCLYKITFNFRIGDKVINQETINIPNTLSVIRLIGVPFLFLLITFENVMWFTGLYIMLGLTDYFDGLLARRWNQVTELGSMLDSIADLAYYISTAYFLIVLFPEYFYPNIPYLYLVFALLAITLLTSKLKFGKVLILHTHLSRLSGVLVFFALFGSFYGDTTLFIRLIILMYSISFVESFVIFFKYGAVDPDTRTIFHLARKNIT